MSEGLTARIGREFFGTVCVAMVTPFDKDGALDLEAARNLADHLVSSGVDSLVLSGTTGESPTTSFAEKIDLLTAVKDAVGDRAQLIAGAGSYDTKASIDLATASVEAGADALLVVTPYYSKPSQEGIYQHFRAISQATPAPICVYDIPARSVVPIMPETMRRIAELETVKGVKDAKGDIAASTPLIQELGLAWYSGDDPLNLPWLSVGATGFISVIGHLAPAKLRQLHTFFDNGDLIAAQKLNAELSPLVAAQARLGAATLSKAGLNLQGIAVGDPRLPIMAASDSEREQLRRDMIQAGVL